MADETNSAVGLRFKDINNELFEEALKNIAPGAKLLRFYRTEIDIVDGHGIGTSLSKDEMEVCLGPNGYRVHYEIKGDNNETTEESKDLVLKMRKETSALQEDYTQFFGSLGEKLKAETRRVSGNVFWKDLTMCDLYSLRLDHLKPFKAILPDIYYLIDNSDQHKYGYVMDNFMSPRNGYSHLNMADTPEVWTHDEICDVMEQLANAHAYFLGRTDQIPKFLSRYFDEPLNLAKILDIKPLMDAHHEVIMKSKPQYFPNDILDIYEKSWTNVSTIFEVLDNAPHTLVHNDCTIRNMCIRTQKKPGQSSVCVFDWEGAGIFAPQHDIVELLHMWLPADMSIETWYKYLDIYRRFLISAVQHQEMTARQDILDSLQQDKFMQICDMCFLEFFIFKQNLYLTCSIMVDFPFLERNLKVRDTVLRYLKGKYKFLQ